jgi:EAL and modified HD-GYP domain-containing signal transduction protein
MSASGQARTIVSIAYIGRQTVFTSELEPAAYELLFRSNHENCAHITDSERSTAEVMLCAVVDIGLPQLTGSLPALINMPRQCLLGGHAYFLPHDQVVLEVLEDVEPDQVVIDALSKLKSEGYAIALDDFVYSPHLLPLVALADIVKVEFPAVSRDQLQDHVKVLRQHEVRLLAEKIETHEDFEFCRELGFDLYQGFFFCKPKVITGDRIPANRLALLRLISRLNSPEVSLADVAEVIHKDPSLSYRLFRFANSAFCATSAPIESLSHAVAIAGLDRVAAFASLSLLTKALDKQSLPLISTALTRAKMCELLATKSSQRADSLFVVGLFSTLDALLNKPLKKVLDFVSLPPDLRAALLTGSGSMGAILKCVLEYEKGNWEHVNCPGLDHRDIFAAYLEAINWAGNVADEVASVESL